MFRHARFPFFAVMQVTPFLPSSQFTLPSSSPHVLDAHFDFWCEEVPPVTLLSRVSLIPPKPAAPFLACHVSVAIVTEWSFPQEFSYREAQFVGPTVSVTVRCSRHSHPSLSLCACHWNERNVSNLDRNVETSNKRMLVHSTV
jgi:hypothetical protein